MAVPTLGNSVEYVDYPGEGEPFEYVYYEYYYDYEYEDEPDTETFQVFLGSTFLNKVLKI